MKGWERHPMQIVTEGELGWPRSHRKRSAVCPKKEHVISINRVSSSRRCAKNKHTRIYQSRRTDEVNTGRTEGVHRHFSVPLQTCRPLSITRRSCWVKVKEAAEDLNSAVSLPLRSHTEEFYCPKSLCATCLSAPPSPEARQSLIFLLHRFASPNN